MNVDLGQGKVGGETEGPVGNIVADTDRHSVLFQPVGDRPQPGRDRLHQQLRGFRRVEPGIDGPLHFGINIGQAADLAVSPPVKYRDRRVPQDRLHENIYSPVKKVFYMLPYNALHYTGIHKVAHFLTEDPDLLIDTAAVGQASGNGIFRLRPGDHDGFGESFPAPVPERRHPGDTSCQEQQFRDLAVQFFADLAQAGRENFIAQIEEALAHWEFRENYPWISIVDSELDSSLDTSNLRDFLWLTFTRSDPAKDVFGYQARMSEKHWACKAPLIVDARIKPHHQKALTVPAEIRERAHHVLEEEKVFGGCK